MNFITVRLLFILIVSLLLSYIYYKINLDKKKKDIIYRIVFVVIVFGIFFIKPEKLFLKFDNIESAFKYSFPFNKKSLVIDNIDYGFVVYQKDKAKDVAYFKKENNKWLFSTNASFYKYKYVGSYVVTMKNIKNSNNYFIYVDSLKKQNKDLIVTDSLNNIYEKHKLGDKNNYYFYMENKPNQYYIFINNEKVEIENF